MNVERRDHVQYLTVSKSYSDDYGKCSKISNTLKLRTPKIITENIF